LIKSRKITIEQRLLCDLIKISLLKINCFYSREKNEMIKMKQELRKKLDYERERLLIEFEVKKKQNKLDLTKFATNYDVALCKFKWIL